MIEPIRFTILGEPASKANSRELVMIGGRPSFIKSKKALRYVRDTVPQIPVPARQRLEGPLRVAMRIYYASELPDLDESLVLDALQDQWSKKDKLTGKRTLLQPGVYRNDRQVRTRFVDHAIDRVNPRTEIIVVPRAAQQLDLMAALEQAEREAALEF
jgi:hypothetical protein